MLITCWSVKGGSGTTVVATSLALLSAQRNVDTLLVDLAGDVPACLGMAEPSSPGLAHWLRAPVPPRMEALRNLEVRASDHLNLLPLGQPVRPHSTHWDVLTRSLRFGFRSVIIDAGVGEPPGALRAASTHDLLVVRGCYMALRRVARLRHGPSGVVLVSEPGRALRKQEVEAVAGVPVVAAIEWDPTVARSIDAGLLAGRVPRTLREGLEALPWMR